MFITALTRSLTTAALSVVAATATAQTSSTTTQNSNDPQRITLPEVTVTAQKEPAKAQDLPVSVTAVTAGMLERAGVSMISDAAIMAPNTVFTEFTARKLSNARFRGLGSSPANPGITTFIDGVPVLNANASSFELVDVEQVEFVRGPQSALFGRNTLGGLVNIASARPNLTRWTGQLRAPLGDNGQREIRGGISGPLADTVAIGLAIGHGERDGFTTNSLTGNVIDDRQGTFGKAQLLWTPNARWETRLIVSGERSRDGDYALSDLGSLRQAPFTVARDFEGYQNRDLWSATALARYEGNRVSVSSTTGYLRWKTRDETDLDYTPLSLVTRDNQEEATQFSQEIRVASGGNAPIRLSDSATMAWQIGAVVFTQNYEQDAINRFSPFLLSPFLGFAIAQHSPKGAIDDLGMGGFAQATVTFANRVDLAVGARADRETKEAALDTFFDPVIAPPTSVNEKVTYSNVSPNASLTVRVRPNAIVYATAGRGYKAGGFNPTAPPAAEAYGEEHTWTVEGGAKTTVADGRVVITAAVFHIDWSDLQLNLPIPMAPGLFYIANVGGATSRGAELEVMTRAARGVDLFGALGLTRARFDAGSTSNGVDVSNNDIPFTPDYTASLGLQVTRDVQSDVTIFGRAEIKRHGAFSYDDTNAAGQDAYTLTNLRAGVSLRGMTIEAWARNLFDTRYIPTAFAYPNFAPSGFVGETGRPRTLGVTLGIGF
jgi:iron complex outermembrane recepter protein